MMVVTDDVTGDVMTGCEWTICLLFVLCVYTL